MRNIVLAISLLATLGAPAFAQGRHHHIAMPTDAGSFEALSPDSAPARSGGRFDATSPHLNADPHPCVWGVACSY